MIASIHIADTGALAGARLLRAQPRTKTAPGLRYAVLMLTSPLSSSRRLPRPTPARIALFSAWESERALAAFQAGDPLAAALSRNGWRATLQPTHLFGAWPELDGIVGREPAMADDEPAAVLTLGRLRLSQAARFVKAGAAAERLAVRDPAMLRGTGMTRPPALVATFSLWSTTASMREYASGRAGSEHRDAVSAHAKRPFHHQSAFFRFRPYGSEGIWDGADPLLAQATSATSGASEASAASTG
jgi:heme-degrading monooxygenase HmoA